MVERERISALMDGEVADEDFAGRIQQLKTEEGGEDWHTYHLIGDVLRGEALLSAGFAQKVQAALASEPTILAPAAIRKPARTFQRYAMAAAASVAGVAVVGWLALVNRDGLPVDVAATVPAGTMAQSGPEVLEYLRAHQEVSPTAAMHGVASYIRTVATQDASSGR
jgi:sigma-E factor negative regulatory protein RseA